VTPLGIGATDCREAVARYRARIGDLVHVLAGDQAPRSAAEPSSLLDDLLGSLEVDMLVRRSGTGEGRMSFVEARIFAPAVKRAHGALHGLSGHPVSPAWVPALNEVDRSFGVADARMARWQHRLGRR